MSIAGTAPGAARVLVCPGAVDDLRRAGRPLARALLLGLTALSAGPAAGRPLGGPGTGWHVHDLASGSDRRSWRAVFRMSGGAAEVWALRSGTVDVPREVASLAAGADGDVAEQLADLVDRLAPETSPRATAGAPDPVPDWLAVRLTATAGIARHVVAAMDAATALDAWADFHADEQSG